MRLAVVALLAVGCATTKPPKAVVIVSANMEWKVVTAAYPHARMATTPWGETFDVAIGGERVVLFHGGWGKVAAAGSAQYAIDRWRPRYVVNRNQQRVLILRGISDLVHAAGGEAYGNMPAFEEGARIVMERLLRELPAWLALMP